MSLDWQSLRSFYKFDQHLTGSGVLILNSIFCVVKMSIRANFPKIDAFKIEDMPGLSMSGASAIISRSGFKGKKRYGNSN